MKITWTVWNFIGKITNGGILVYNEDDAEVKRVSKLQQTQFENYYQYSKYTVSDGVTLGNPEGDMPIEVLSAYLYNLAGAKWICQNMRWWSRFLWSYCQF
jgi:UDP-N-acetylmuramate: L-alanyl-gamma-D-glutamyl-meso-diaminopimelate ligase